MASLTQNKSTGRFYVRFRYAGASYKRSLKTNSPGAAEAALARLEAVVYTQVTLFGPKASHAVAKSHILRMPTQTVCGPGAGSLGRLL